MSESTIRLSFFIGILVAMALWELAAPRRALTVSKSRRWTNNLGVVVLGMVVVRLLFPVAAVGVATFAQAQGWGALNHWALPRGAAVALSLVALDLVIYLQHVMFHAVPVLWRLHMMHHADLDLDVTSGLRFHPVEFVISMGIKIAAVALLGAPPVAVVIFEIVLNATAMFNHGNVRIPLGLDRVLRWVVVTPDMHRVHHSVDAGESNHNFGFNLPWWDRLMGTYRAQPAAGHDAMTIGLTPFLEHRRQSLWWLLVMPFTERPGNYAINRRGHENPSEDGLA